MWDLLRVAILLALPILVFGALTWVLFYSAVRLALRHEAERLQKRTPRSTRTTTGSRPVARRPSQGAQGNGRAQPSSGRVSTGTARERPRTEAEAGPFVRQRRAAS